jgi:hypothetical protein
MIRRLTRWLAPILVAGLFAAVAHAQRGDSTLPGDEAPPRGAVLPYALALLFTLGMLVVLCMPSRKS